MSSVSVLRHGAAALVILAAAAPPASAQATAIDRTGRALEVKNFLQIRRAQMPALRARHAPPDAFGARLTSVERFLQAPLSVDAPTFQLLTEVRDSLWALPTQRDSSAPAFEIAPAASPPPPERTVTLQGGTQVVGAEARIISGVTGFFIARAKAELVYSYFDAIRGTLDKNPVIDSLLPNVAAIVRELDVMPPRSLLTTLRAAAMRDFGALPNRATNLRTYPTGFLKLTDKDLLLLQGAHQLVVVTEGVHRGDDAAVAIAKFATLDGLDIDRIDVRDALIATGLLALEYAVDATSVRQVVADPDERPVFVAFLASDLQSAPGFKLPPDGAFQKARDLFRGRDQQIESLTTSLATFQAEIAKLQDSTKALADSVRTEALGRMARAAARFVRAASTAAPQQLTMGSEIEQFVALAGELKESILARDYGTTVVAVSRILARGAGDKRPPSAAFRVLALAGDIAAATDDSSITKAIEAAADPVGSYRAKRTTNSGGHVRSLTLQGYVGLGGGKEWAMNGPATQKGKGQFGASLPVGVEFSVGGFARGWKGLLTSWGLFVPIADLGNVASVRLSSDTLENAPEIGFAQVLSPGVYSMWGLGKAQPFSVGIGAQFAPALRVTKGTNIKTSILRASIILGIDVPVLRF